MADHPKQWQCLKTERGPDLKLFRVRYDYMQNPRNGSTAKMTILEANDSVNVVALTPEQQILFVRQYRFGTGNYTLELPGGIVDDGEEARLAGERELREETGFSSSDWQSLGKVGSNPVFMDSYIHHWLAKDIQLTDEVELDDGEAIELVRLSIKEVKQRLCEGLFLHPHTISALTRFFFLFVEK